MVSPGPQWVKCEYTELALSFLRLYFLNSLSRGRFGSNFINVIFKLIIQNSSMDNHCKFDGEMKWMPQTLINEKSTLIQVMTWCRQVTSHYLRQCWLRLMLTYGITRPQWVKIWKTLTLWTDQEVDMHGLGRDCGNSSTLAEELSNFCTEPSVYFLWVWPEGTKANTSTTVWQVRSLRNDLFRETRALHPLTYHGSDVKDNSLHQSCQHALNW